MSGNKNIKEGRKELFPVQFIFQFWKTWSPGAKICVDNDVQRPQIVSVRPLPLHQYIDCLPTV